MSLRVYITVAALVFLSCCSPGNSSGDTSWRLSNEKLPVVVITDLYHPHQDAGDNMDLINAFALDNVDLRAVLLDVTASFREPLSSHPSLWQDPYGPREPGVIPVMQLNYIFDRTVPFGIGPSTMMRSAGDRMEQAPKFERQAVELLLKVLRESQEPVQILSFGSARIPAVAYNTDPALLREKVSRIHLSAGCARKAGAEYDKPDGGPTGGEWNVALDPHAFVRIVTSDLPVALYPCAGANGVFETDENSSYWKLDDMGFLRDMDPKLQCYLRFVFERTLDNSSYLAAMDRGAPYSEGLVVPPESFHVWESAAWLMATDRRIVDCGDGRFVIKRAAEITPGETVVEDELVPCKLDVDREGNFTFRHTDGNSNISIYRRPDPSLNQRALNSAVPLLYGSYRP